MTLFHVVLDDFLRGPRVGEGGFLALDPENKRVEKADRFRRFCLRKNYGVFVLAGVTLMFHPTLRSSIFLPGEAYLDAALNDLAYRMFFYFFGKLKRILKGHLILVFAFAFWVHTATDTIDMHRPPVVDINS